MLQRLLLLDHLGEKRVLFSDPVEMGVKTAAAHYSAAVALWPGARTMGHDGILISHGCWDRAIYSACSRLMAQRSLAFRLHQQYDNDHEDVDVHLRWLKLWCTSAGCSAHDFSNSLRWSSLSEFADRQIMRRMWIVIESLRSSLDQLISNLAGWIGDSIQFGDYHGPLCLFSVWRLLGLSEQWAHELAELEFRFESGHLIVGSRFRDDEAVPQRLADCYLHLFEFRSWSDTRWCAVGRACRRLLACELAGLGSLVDFIRSSPSESKYYIEGYQNIAQDIRRLIVIVGLTARVSEEPLALILKDDRLPKMLAEVDEAIALQRDRVLQLDEFVIQHFASFADVSSQALINDLHHSVAVQIAYAENRLRSARGLPWSLVGGDVEGKLQRLRDGPPPEEEVAGKIHALLHLGVPMEIVKAGVDLLGEMPFSTRLVEQGHAVSAGLMKWHRKYTSATMMARSVVSSTKQLVDVGVARLASQRAKALDRVAMLRRKQPSQCHGRQAFVGSLLQEARPAHSSEEYDRIVRPRLMKEHAEKWQALSREEREDFVNRANQIRDNRQQQKREMIQAEVGKIRELNREILDEQARGQSLRMSACSWGEAQKADFENLYRDDRWSPSYVKNVRSTAVLPVHAPPQLTMDVLQSMAVGTGSHGEVPEWLSWVCAHRVFRTCLLRWKQAREGEEDHFVFYQFIFAMQNPRFVALMEVEEEEVVEGVVSPSELFGEGSHAWEHFFRCTWQCRFSDDGVFEGAQDLEVLPNTVYTCTSLLCSASNWKSFASLERILPRATTTSRSSTADAGGSEDQPSLLVPEPWMEYPAMWEFLKEEVKPKVTKPRVRKKLFGSRGADEHHARMDAEEAVETLVRRRAEMGGDDEEEWRGRFRVTLRGGKWTAAVHGLAFDCYAAYVVKNSDAERFLHLYSLTQSGSWSIRAYSDDGAFTLAKAWVHRLFFTL